MVEAGRAEELRGGMPFIGGSLWIDLLNTIVADRGPPRDLFDAPGGYGAWLAAAALPPSHDTLAPMRALRERLRQAFERLRAGEPPDDATLEAVNRELDQVAVGLRLERGAGRLALTSRLVGAAPGWVAEDFARFVSDFEPERLKHCANPACVMVFFDRGKNNQRRWCSMSLCGNRDKVARFRARRAEAER